MRAVDFYKRFGRRVAKLRKKAGVSQEKLADAIALSRTSVTNIERGRQPVQLHTLYSIADALGVEPPDLLPAVPDISVLLSGITSGIEKLSPKEKGPLEDLGIREKGWLNQIAKPTAGKGRRR
jgi:transcriptional regulator with XRE-family HTH domain